MDTKQREMTDNPHGKTNSAEDTTPEPANPTETTTESNEAGKNETENNGTADIEIVYENEKPKTKTEQILNSVQNIMSGVFSTNNVEMTDKNGNENGDEPKVDFEYTENDKESEIKQADIDMAEKIISVIEEAKTPNKNSEIIQSMETEVRKNSAQLTKERIQSFIKTNVEYLILALATFALVMSFIILFGIYGSWQSKLDECQKIYDDNLAANMHYEGTDLMDECQKIYVGDYYGWSYAGYRDASYRANKNDYQGGNDVQYPLPDIRVRYGDQLIFTRSDNSLKDDLLLVTPDLYDSCDFTQYTNEDGEMLESSEILLAPEQDLYDSQYMINVTESLPDTLLFTSSYKWDAKNGGSCLGGLKVRVIVDRSFRSLMTVRRSSDKWRGIGSTETVINLDAAIGHVSRQLTLSHFNHEQRIRSNGDSGISNVRGLYDGSAAYDELAHTNYGSGSIHDHSDNIRVIGIGEIEAVLNGVEFQTKHGDYELNQPSKKAYEFGETEEIEFPDVPDKVTSAGSTENQIKEMQEWFRAFKNQDASERDYTQYFKPILCYLEGTWVLSEAPLYSPLKLWMKNNGRNNLKEGLSFAPSSIRNLQNNTYPIISNWDYQILCHPLKHDIPTSRFRVTQDLSTQLFGSPKTNDELYFDNKARFELNKYINIADIENDNQWTTSRYQWNYLDYLMEQIPGKDNYMGNVSDQLPDGSGPILHSVNDQWINSGYYSRYYKLSEGDAMGSTGHRRSYSDRNLFAAKTTQRNVSPIQMLFEVQNETTEEITFYPTISRWSYAIPLEIIYLTPLTKWNPYKIKEKSAKDFDYNRKGGCDSSSDAYNGYTFDKAYFTPSEFYTESNRDDICALDGSGNVQNVQGSGHYIVLPEIGGSVGQIRQRYPIFPLHNGGSSEFKELKALQTIMKLNDENSVLNENQYFAENRELLFGVLLDLRGGGHGHRIYISEMEIKNKWYDSTSEEWLSSSEDIIEIESNAMNGHQHTLKIWRQKNNNEWQYHIKQCRFGTLSDKINEWSDNECPDYHNRISE